MTRLRHHRGDERGSTLLELVITVVIMAIFMTIFTTGMLQMYRGANENQAAADAQSQIHLAFLRLDKQLRYASGISVPDQTTDYVEYLTANSGAPVCTELRMTAGGLLQSRSWTQGMTPLVPGAWTVLASGIAAATPFSRVDPTSTENFQQLRLQLTATAGAGDRAATRATDVTFTAMNTSLATDSDTVCTEGRSIP